MSFTIKIAYSIILALIFIAFMAIAVVIIKIVSKKNLIAASERQEAIARLTGIAEEYYTGRDIIKAFNHEEESVKKVYKAVDEVRISTRDADVILYMANGNITEQGTHEQLLRKGGAYAALYNSQFA
ncbi:MAG: ABC transporter transmembrane domain-containing protein [Oscillospiraceae bacterium]